MGEKIHLPFTCYRHQRSKHSIHNSSHIIPAFCFWYPTSCDTGTKKEFTSKLHVCVHSPQPYTEQLNNDGTYTRPKYRSTYKRRPFVSSSHHYSMEQHVKCWSPLKKGFCRLNLSGKAGVQKMLNKASWTFQEALSYLGYWRKAARMYVFTCISISKRLERFRSNLIPLFPFGLIRSLHDSCALS